jgi:acetoin utilization deacetylase AcuC-like enzyme
MRPDAHALEPVFRVHDRGYIDFLREACAEWRKLPDASDDVMPNTHSRRFLRTALKRLLISELNGRRALGPLPRPALRWERLG